MNENKKIIFCLGIMHNAIRKIADTKFMEIHHELSGMYVLILLYLEQQEQENTGTYIDGYIAPDLKIQDVEVHITKEMVLMGSTIKLKSLYRKRI